MTVPKRLKVSSMSASSTAQATLPTQTVVEGGLRGPSEAERTSRAGRSSRFVRSGRSERGGLGVERRNSGVRPSRSI
jgi:hypothetical protein